MKVIVIGGGIAGMSAAWTLRESGHEVTILEKDYDAGGRCRSFKWNGIYVQRGAEAFIGSEDNLIELAKALGIYDTLPRTEYLDTTPRYHVVHKDKGVVSFDDFDLLQVIKSDVFPVKEKLALGRVVPRMLKQLAACDPHDPVSAAEFDDQNACEYFREYSPQFVDYFLDPCLSLFCGYGEEDYSLAWLLWLFSSRLNWGGNHWWGFTERGVGQLTRSLGEHFAQDDGTTMLYHVTAQELRVNQDNVEVDVNRHGAVETLVADRAVLAVPGTLVTNLFPGLDAERRKLFENVSYSGHHCAWYLLDEPPREDLPATRVLLPTADGYRAVTAVWFTPTEDGRTLVIAHWKNQRSKETQEWSSDDVLADGWREITRAFPQVRDAPIFDQYIERNDLAIARRPKGYLRELKQFRDLGPLDRVTFAGDYLVNSTVGQAHWSGMRAAKELLGTWQN